jgi:hypothetical protein
MLGITVLPLVRSPTGSCAAERVLHETGAEADGDDIS